MVRSQAMWAKMLSMESPTRAQFRAFNAGSMEAKVMNSVVQTGVKSAGWEKRITHRPL